MRLNHDHFEAIPLLWRRVALVAALISAFLMAALASGAGNYGQVGIFAGILGTPPVPPAEFPEEVQLAGTGGMAVNSSGAGGVEPGTVYVASLIDDFRIAMYEPKEGGLEFVQSWGVRTGERCGPLAIAEGVGTNCPPRPNAQAKAVDVDVDQATGNVYAFNGEVSTPGLSLISEYTADGSEEITRFGVRAESGKTTAQTPSEIHESQQTGGIAVDGSGRVYVFDVNNSDNFYHRLMAFEPQTPGDFEHYVYAGEAQDVGAGFQGQGRFPEKPVADAAGDVYVLAQDRYIQKYDPDQPSAAPVCEFEFAKGGVSALTVDPESGEVFFFSEKKEAGFTHKLIHQLSPCAGGAFKEVGKFEVAPERDDLFALALDPAREFSPGRPAGVLYGGAPEAVPPIGPGEPGQSSLGYIFAPPEENPPVIEAESVSKATATTAQLRAVIDPKGFPTHYSFQYITDAAYAENPPGEEFNGATEAPLAGADVQAGQGQTAVAVTLTGLLPDTGYHFRVVAQSNCAPGEPEKICAVQGADETFRTAVAPGPVLPDARAYELVSPAQKNGGQVLPADSRISSCGYPECKPGLGYTRFPLQSSPDGGAIAYEGTTSFTPGAGAPVENSYIARRDPSAGWLTANPTPALMGSRGGNGYKAFDPGLTETLLQQNLPALTAALPEYANLYRQATASPLALENLLTQAPPNRPPGLGSDELELTYRGASADLSRVFFTANDALTAETPSAPEASGGPAGEVNLYEWAAGQLALVNVLPANTASSPGAAFAPAASYGVSADGSRAFWTSKAGGLYVRIDATETRQIEDPGKFLAASADGTEVLLDDGCLYDVEAEACEDLTADQSEVHQGGFGALLGKSEDLSRVYFVIRPTKGTGDLSKGSTAVTDVHATTGAFRVGQAIVGAGIPAGATIVAVGTETLQLSAPATEASADAALAAQGLLTGNEENSEGAKAQAGGPNLYAHEEGSTTFIATLAAKDSAGGADSEASPGGHWLAFLSVAPLTGYDNLGPCEHTGGGETLLIPCPEVFLYDSDTGELRCPSCNSTNARPLGEAVLRQIEGSTQKPRYLTDSGRLFFDTQDSLVAADTNAGAEDVYQFEPAGIGTCGREAGCVSLISGGREATDSNFLAMDPAGENVFFTTRERLLPADTDELIDLYDARVGGGFAFESAPAPSGCSGEACQPALPAPPAPQPNSQAQTEGNYHPPKCKKGQVRRGGKCVKKNQHKGKAKKGKGHAKGQKREGSR